MCFAMILSRRCLAAALVAITALLPGEPALAVVLERVPELGASAAVSAGASAAGALPGAGASLSAPGLPPAPVALAAAGGTARPTASAAAPGAAPAAAAEARAPSVAEIKAWRPVVAGLAARLSIEPDLDPSRTLRRALAHATVELALDRKAGMALAFLAELLPGAASPAAFAARDARDQVLALQVAVGKASERLTPRVDFLLSQARGRELSDAEEAEVLRLASAWFYLPEETAGRLRVLAAEIRDERTRGRARRIAEALGWPTRESRDSERVAKAELGLLFQGTHALLAAAPAPAVREVLLPYAARALQESTGRFAQRGEPTLTLATRILTDHAKTFGGVEAQDLRLALRAKKEWTEFVAALVLAAASQARASADARDARRLLGQAGKDDNLRLAIPAWHPFAGLYGTAADYLQDGREAPKDRTASQGLPLFTLFGIKFRSDAGFLAFFAGSTWELARLFFPVAAPGHATATYWLLGAAATAALSVSLTVHELAHALTARLYGLKTRRIFFHIIGGQAEIEGDPRRSSVEALIALAGPATNLVLGLAGLAAAKIAGDWAWGPALLGYFTISNLSLGLFNLLPAFPMDGGRALRAGLARVLNDHYRATKAAAFLGKVFAYLMLGAGVYFLAHLTLSGAVTAVAAFVTGWFLRKAVKEAGAHPGTETIEAPASTPAVRRMRNFWTILKIAVVWPLIAAAVPLGRVEVFLRRRALRGLYPRAKTLGGGHSNLVMLDTDALGRKSIVKQYGVTGTLLAALGRFLLPVHNPGGVHRMERFRSDRAAFADFAAAGIPASLLVSSDEKTGTNVNTFVPGAPLVSVMQKDPAVLIESGRSLRQAHDRGWAIIDIQPSNFIMNSAGRAAFIDLEHAHRDPRGEFRAWDLAIYLCWLKASFKDEDAAAQAAAAFWRGYGSIDDDLAAAVGDLRARLKLFRFFMKVSSLDSELSSQ